jgi:cyclic beta-1,2-glucan synthetase
VEPYVAAADVYAVWPHTGRGGWTWYTGSASWMYRAGLEYILGFRLSGERLLVDPCVFQSWREFEIFYRHGSSQYSIRVENPYGVNRGVIGVELDGRPLPSHEIPLEDDGGEHTVRVLMGSHPEVPAEEERIGARRAATGTEGVKSD